MPLSSALSLLPPGPWAVAVSGGADSVALLRLALEQPGLSLHVVHLDHQTRGGQSALDADFVADLARRHGLPLALARRDDVAPLVARPSANASAYFRQLRLALFRRTVREHNLQGVLLAHHADDQAETVLQRLLRGSGPAGLAGIRPATRMAGLLLVRPLLSVRRQVLREYLRSIGQAWREDGSNLTDQYQRNRVRKLLSRVPQLVDPLLDMAAAFAELRHWIRSAAPDLPESFAPAMLADLPPILATESARRWLIARGAPPGQLEPAVLQRLVAMAADAAAPPRKHFPGGLLIRRRGSRILADAHL